MTISEPGEYPWVKAVDYHRDVTPDPSLSASIAHILLDQSPRHAWEAHALLNPDFAPEEDEKFDLGKAFHGLKLEGEANVAILDFPDWRTKAAKLARVEARKAGKTPILKDRWADVLAMDSAVKVQLARFQEQPIPLTGGRPEVTLVWKETLPGNQSWIWCRARPDWLHDGNRALDDLKSTGGSANPDVWTRGALFDNGYDLQAAFYLRGVYMVHGMAALHAAFRFVVCETYPPYACSVIGLSPDVLVLGEKKRRLAVELWGECVRTNKWPAYPTRTCYATLPPYVEARWLERELREEPAYQCPSHVKDCHTPLPHRHDVGPPGDDQRDIAEVL